MNLEAEEMSGLEERMLQDLPDYIERSRILAHCFGKHCVSPFPHLQ